MLYIPGLLANDRIAFPMLGCYMTSSVQVKQKCYDFLIKILIVRHSKAFYLLSQLALFQGVHWCGFFDGHAAWEINLNYFQVGYFCRLLAYPDLTSKRFFCKHIKGFNLNIKFIKSCYLWTGFQENECVTYVELNSHKIFNWLHKKWSHSHSCV